MALWNLHPSRSRMLRTFGPPSHQEVKVFILKPQTPAPGALDVCNHLHNSLTHRYQKEREGRAGLIEGGSLAVNSA